MQEILLVFFTLLAVVCAVIAILKKFNSRFAFIALGLIFMLIATWIKGTSVLGEDSTGSLVLDVFDVVRVKLKDTAGGIGATVMMGGRICALYEPYQSFQRTGQRRSAPS